MYVIKTDNPEQKKVIVGVYGESYIIKDYDTEERKYLEGYSLVEMMNKEVVYLKGMF